MPSGIILSSSSQGATKEAIEKVLSDNGYEADKPAVTEKQEADEQIEDDAGKAEAAEGITEKDGADDTVEEVHANKDTPKLSRRQKAAERDRQRIAALERELREIREAKKPEAPAPELKAPQRDQFKTDEEFEDAKFDFRYKQRRAKEESDAAKARLEYKLQQSFTDYQSSVAEFKEEHDDWDAVVNSTVPISEPVYFSIVELGSEGPAVTYYLGQHPEELERLAELTPHRVTIEIARLADKLNKPQKREAAAATPKPKPKLPEPVQPVSGSATQSSLTSRDAAASRNYRAFKVAQRAGR